MRKVVFIDSRRRVSSKAKPQIHIVFILKRLNIYVATYRYLSFKVWNGDGIVFGWLYKRIADGVIQNIDVKDTILKMMGDEEFQKQLLSLSDGLYERYKIKVMNTIGGWQKGVNNDGGLELPEILDKKGHIQLKGLLPIAMAWLTGNKGQPSGGSPQSSNIPKELTL